MHSWAAPLTRGYRTSRNADTEHDSIRESGTYGQRRRGCHDERVSRPVAVLCLRSDQHAHRRNAEDLYEE
jgi:hypothetical protein